MENIPHFLRGEWSIEDVGGSYRPVKSDRRGEWLAWLSAAGAALGTALLAWRTGRVAGLGVGATLTFSILAVLVSFGNWLDRNTVVEVRTEFISYRSPLRHRKLTWDQIESLKLSPSNRGWRIQVSGAGKAFQFMSGGSLRIGDLDEMEVGIPGGTGIAGYIQSRCNLNSIEPHDQGWVCRRGTRDSD